MLALALALACCAPAAVHAADGFQRDRTPLPASIGGAASDPGAAAEAGSSGSGVVRMFFGLAIVLAIMYGLYRLLKRSAGRNDGLRGHGQMTLVASTPLAPSRAVHLVQVGNELVLVGSSERGVTRLRVYDAEEVRRLGLETQAPMHRLTAPTGDRAGFGYALVEALRRKTAR